MSAAPPTSPQSLCPHCGFNLAGLCPTGVTAGVCPMCGKNFDLLRLDAPDPRRRRMANRWLVIWLLVTLAAGGLTVVASAVDHDDLAVTMVVWTMSLVAVTIVSGLTAVFNVMRLGRRQTGAAVALFIILWPLLAVAGCLGVTFLMIAGCSMVGPTLDFR